MRRISALAVLALFLSGCTGDSPVSPTSDSSAAPSRFESPGAVRAETAGDVPGETQRPSAVSPTHATSSGEDSSAEVPASPPGALLEILQTTENETLPRARVILPPEHAEPGFARLAADGRLDLKRARRTLSVRLASETQAETPPVLGEYALAGNELTFTPAVPLLPGRKYVARFDPAALGGEGALSGVQEQAFEIPQQSASVPRITAIYPSGPIVPANHLKFYIVFSEPMQQGDIFRYFRLENLTTGEPTPDPFRHTELWSEDNRRLTLWFHPGRQKTGVNLNVDIGPVLQEDEEYRLVISGDWTSQQGVALGAPYSREFRAGKADHSQPDVSTWICPNPRAGTREMLRCELHEPLDWALLHTAVQLKDPEGKRVPGSIEPGFAELSWNFQPDEAWRPGLYRLEVQSILEDLAGNSIERPFEVDVEKPSATEAAPRVVVREIEVSAP